MKKIRYEDRLKGGVDAANLTKYLQRFDPEEVQAGIEAEKEHTKDPDVAAEIASDHLGGEDPHYYSKLKKAGITGESIDVLEFNFFDILESDEDDVPIGASAKPLDLTTKAKTKEEPKAAPHQTVRQKAAKGREIRLAHRASEREKYKAEYTKMGKSPEEAEQILGSTFDKTKDKGGRPRTGDRNKYRLGLLGGNKAFPGKPNETPPSWAGRETGAPTVPDRTPERTRIANTELSTGVKRKAPRLGTRTNMFRTNDPEGAPEQLPYRHIKDKAYYQNAYRDVHALDKPKQEPEPLKSKKTDPSYAKQGRNISYQQIFKVGK